MLFRSGGGVVVGPGCGGVSEERRGKEEDDVRAEKDVAFLHDAEDGVGVLTLRVDESKSDIGACGERGVSSSPSPGPFSTAPSTTDLRRTRVEAYVPLEDASLGLNRKRLQGSSCRATGCNGEDREGGGPLSLHNTAR